MFCLESIRNVLLRWEIGFLRWVWQFFFVWKSFYSWGSIRNFLFLTVLILVGVKKFFGGKICYFWVSITYVFFRWKINYFRRVWKTFPLRNWLVLDKYNEGDIVLFCRIWKAFFVWKSDDYFLVNMRDFFRIEIII